jgi:hypothetical protein
MYLNLADLIRVPILNLWARADLANGTGRGARDQSVGESAGHSAGPIMAIEAIDSAAKE